MRNRCCLVLLSTLKLRQRVMDRFEQGASKNTLDGQVDNLIHSLKFETKVCRNVHDSAVSLANTESNYVVNEIPDMIFKESSSLNIIKNLYINELTNLKLKQAISSKLVEKEIYKQ